MIIHLDFETYCEAPLKKVGAWYYAQHPSSEIICLAWSYDYGAPHIWYPGCPDGDRHLQDLFNHIAKGAKLYAWNAYFEFVMWEYCATRTLSWPSIPKQQWHDSMAIAQSLGLPGQLDKCGEALNLDITKDKNGKRLISKLSKPRKPSKNNPATRWTPETAPEDYAQFYEYCKRDVESEAAIHKRLSSYELSRFERLMWLMTLRINDRGVPIDMDLVRKLKAQLLEYSETIVSEVPALTNGHVQTTNQIEKLREWIYYNEKGMVIPDLAKETVTDTLSLALLPNTRRVLEIRQALSKISTKKYDHILRSADGLGFVHDVMRYHKATTGRWGGTGLQIHNLPRSKTKNPELAAWVIKQGDLKFTSVFFDSPMELGSKMIRPSICARPDNELFVSDFNSIENRMLCWLAGDTKALKLFERGVDQYRWFATKLYPGTAYDEVSDSQRLHAKTCILGLGFGMGAIKFKATCDSYGLSFSVAECQRAVDLYREIYISVVKFWYSLHRTAMDAITSKNRRTLRHLAFHVEDDFLFMTLPSKRKIAYYKPRVEMVDTPWGKRQKGITHMGTQPKTYKWARLTTTPGRLAENATQAAARDILAEAKLRVFKAGYNVLFSVHDEVVCEEEKGQKELVKYNQIMCDVDQRVYPGLPVAAKGYIAKRYRKD